jgi:hypothetical protein
MQAAHEFLAASMGCKSNCRATPRSLADCSTTTIDGRQGARKIKFSVAVPVWNVLLGVVNTKAGRGTQNTFPREGRPVPRTRLMFVADDAHLVKAVYEPYRLRPNAISEFVGQRHNVGSRYLLDTELVPKRHE